MKWFRRLQCILFGHRELSVATVVNQSDDYNQQVRYGFFRCSRCGKIEDW